jgi:hypothetical protein
MKFIGKISEITNLQKFATSFLQNSQKPDPATFKAMPNIQVRLVTDFPVGFSNSFIPNFSFKTDATAQGDFTIDVPEIVPKTAKAYIIAFREFLPKLPPPFPKILFPVYRSATFTVGSLDTKTHSIFVACPPVSNENGISPDQVSQQVQQAKNSFKQLSSLSATIQNGGIHVKGEGKGATVNFDVQLKPATSFDLNEFITQDLANFDIDLPGPDIITGLCISKADIEANIASSVKGLIKTVNSQIKTTLIQAIATSQKVDPMLVTQLFNTQMSLTFHSINYPVTKEINVGGFKFQWRAIVPEPCVGFPRNLF